MIYLIITACVHNKYGVVDSEVRKTRYIQSIQTALTHLPNHIIPIIVENSCDNIDDPPTRSYLDEFESRCSVFIYQIEPLIGNAHKGVNELYDIHEAIRIYGIQDDDMIIKLTGRYEPTNGWFFQYVSEHVDQYDAFVKFFNVCTLEFMHDDCALGLVAMRCKYWKPFSYRCERSPEVEFATMIREKIDADRIREIETLHLRCCFADDLRVLDI